MKSVPETTETPGVLAVDLHLTHEVTSPQAFAQLQSARPESAPAGTHARDARSRRADRTARYSRPADPARGRARQIGELERNCAQYGVELLGLRDERRGIVHVIGRSSG